jgi:hypothetical protein
MKKHLLSILTIVLAVAGSAFTLVTPEAKATQDCVWFIYDGNESGPGFPSDADEAKMAVNYRRATENEQLALCQGSSVLCAICAPVSSNPDQPLISLGSTVETQIEAYFVDPNDTYSLILEKP